MGSFGIEAVIDWVAGSQLGAGLEGAAFFFKGRASWEVMPFTGSPGLSHLDFQCKFEPVLFFFMNRLFVMRGNTTSHPLLCEALGTGVLFLDGRW